MAQKYRYFRDNERGLSEVVGFVLILGVLVLVFSLYLTYGIPVQGRDNEIIHMNEVKDEFVNYKVGVDSLWTNYQPDTIMSSTFKLGTAGQTSQGSNSIIPVMQPMGSSGEMVINQRIKPQERLSISSNSLVLNTRRHPAAFPMTGPLTFSDPTPPSGIRFYIDTTTASLSDVSVPYGLDIKGTQQGDTRWEVLINLTPRFNFARYSTYTGYNPMSGQLTGETIHEDYSYNRTDLTFTVIKGGNKTLDGFIIYSAVQNTPGNYSVNILDDAYGLKNYISTDRIDVTSPSNISLSCPIQSSGEIKYLYQDQSFEYSQVPLGSLEYRGYNNYWVPQTYYYQMGGIFLSQSDGVSAKIPPSITFTNASGGLVNVSIIAITYDTGIQQEIGGVSPVQIRTIMKSDSGDIPLATVNPNTWNMSINITTPDEKTMVMWKDYFTESAQSAGWPESYYSVGNTTSSPYYDGYITIRGQNSLSTRNMDLKVKTVNLTAQVQGTGVMK
jgi:hypothetical protein